MGRTGVVPGCRRPVCRDRARPPPAPPGVPPQARVRRTAWLRPVWAGVALLLAGSPVGAVVQGTSSWWGYAAGAVGLVVAVGLLGAAVRPRVVVGVVAAQIAALALLLTGLFTGSGVLGIVPGPAAVGELTALVGDAATQIRTEAAPVPATPAMLLLVTLAFGVTAVAVHAVTVGAGAPARSGCYCSRCSPSPPRSPTTCYPRGCRPRVRPASGSCSSPGPARRRTTGSGARAWVPPGSWPPPSVLGPGSGCRSRGRGDAGRFPSTGGVGASRVGEIGLSPFTALRGELLQYGQRAVPGHRPPAAHISPGR